MTTEHYLWAIFALLWIALVLVVVTARRGPWQAPKRSAGVLWIPAELAGYAEESPQDEEFLRELQAMLATSVTDTSSVPRVCLMAPGVDPLWGKNPPKP